MLSANLYTILSSSLFDFHMLCPNGTTKRRHRNFCSRQKQKMQINAKNMLKSKITGAHLNKLQAVKVEGESGTPPHGTSYGAEVTDLQHIMPPTGTEGFVGASRWL